MDNTNFRSHLVTEIVAKFHPRYSIFAWQLQIEKNGIPHYIYAVRTRHRWAPGSSLIASQVRHIHYLSWSARFYRYTSSPSLSTCPSPGSLPCRFGAFLLHHSYLTRPGAQKSLLLGIPCCRIYSRQRGAYTICFLLLHPAVTRTVWNTISGASTFIREDPLGCWGQFGTGDSWEWRERFV